MSFDNLCIVTPCFEDYDSLEMLVRDIAKLDSPAIPINVHIYIVNDSPWSSLDIDRLSSIVRASFQGINKIRTIQSIVLHRNIGHQHSLCVGLSKAFAEHSANSAYLLMDCDGEDSPLHIPTLVLALQSSCVYASVAARSKRHEPLMFRLGYLAYKKLFRILSGDTIDFGNFMYLLPEAARSLVYSPSSRSHLAASLIRSRIPFLRVRLDRSPRYSGCSRMGGSIALVGYGIKAISVFADRVMTRLLILCGLGLALILTFLLLLVINYFLVIIPPIPGWTSLIALSLVMVAILGVLITLDSLLLMPPLPLLIKLDEESMLINNSRSAFLHLDLKANVYEKPVQLVMRPSKC